MQPTLLGFAPTRALLRQFALPKPGQGPSKEERETGMYDVLFVGDTPMAAHAARQRQRRQGSRLRLDLEDDHRSCTLPERHATQPRPAASGRRPPPWAMR